jgi:hypothetical protein
MSAVDIILGSLAIKVSIPNFAKVFLRFNDKYGVMAV